LLLDTPQPDAASQSSFSQRVPLAPAWHTVVVLFALLGTSLAGFEAAHSTSHAGKLTEYLWTMTWEWLLTGFVYLGIRKRSKLRDLIGGRWATFDAFLLDVIVATGFWLASIVVLGIAAKLMHVDEGGKVDSMRRQLGFLAPGTTLELLIWFCLSATAGFCEEVIFRGYLQQQFASITRSTLAGVLLSAIVFGAAHGYEGGPRMVLIAIFGLMFGLLAWWRRSLRPGMIAHAWHDALSGAVLRLLK